MVMYDVYTSNIKRKYRAHFCSFATLFLICTLGLTVICPVLVAYHSNGKNNFHVLTLQDCEVGRGTYVLILIKVSQIDVKGSKKRFWKLF